MKRLSPLLFAVAFALAASSAAHAGGPVTVVELYTSQGCNSCPPADEMLGDIAARDDVVALSLHVNYWDYLGWKDTFATDVTTSRQRNYGRTMRGGRVYTPQMVIGGTVHVVGSNRYGVEWAMLSDKHRAPNPVEVSLDTDEDGTVIAHVGAAAGGESGSATVWLFRYDSRQQVAIGRGENAGKELTYTNVVREVRDIGTWRGAAMDIPLALSDLAAGGRDGCAVVVQRDRLGPVIGAARMDIVPTN